MPSTHWGLPARGFAKQIGMVSVLVSCRVCEIHRLASCMSGGTSFPECSLSCRALDLPTCEPDPPVMGVLPELRSIEKHHHHTFIFWHDTKYVHVILIVPMSLTSVATLDACDVCIKAGI